MENERQKERFMGDRPLVWAALILLSFIALGWFLPLWAAFASLSALAPLFVWQKTRKRAAVYLLFALCGILLVTRAAAPLHRAERETERTVSLTGIVVENTDTAVLLDRITVDGEAFPGRHRLYYDAEYPVIYREGDLLSTECELKVKNIYGNAGSEFDRINNTRKDLWIYFSKPVEIKTEKTELPFFFSMRLRTELFFRSAREHLQEAVFLAVPDETCAGICYGMLVGDSSLVDEETYDVFDAGGILHLLAVSGLHVGLMAAALDLLLRRVPAHLWGRRILVLILLAVYVGICGASPSAVRAYILFAVAMTMPLLKREADGLSSLALAAILLCLFDPLVMFSLSFRLSFGAVGMLILFGAGKREKEEDAPLWKRFGRSMGSVLRGSAAAQCGILPATLAVFGTVPTASLLVNLVLIPCTGILLAACWLTVLPALCGMVIPPCGTVTVFLFRSVIAFTRFVSGIFPKVFLPVLPNFAARALFFLLLFSVSRICILSKKRKKLLAPILSVLLILTLAVPKIADRNRERVVMLDVGQGQCVLIQTDGKNILCDCGTTAYGGLSASRLASALRQLGVGKVDLLILSHLDEDHSMLALPLAEVFPVKDAVTDASMQRDWEALGVSWRNCGARVRRYLDDRVEILSGTGGNDNNGSLIVSVRLDDFSVLITGDAERSAEKRLAERGIAPHDVLIVGHHGSKNSTSEELLDAIRPEVALISAGRNNFYGHPHEETLERLAARNVRVYATTECGMIEAERRRDGWRITPYYENGYPMEGGAAWITENSRAN